MTSSAPLKVRDRLAAGPARGLGAANALAAEATAKPQILRELVEALGDERETVAGRAANALKKVQTLAPRALDPYAHTLLQRALACTALEARWNLTLVVGRLPLKAGDRALAIDLMFEALGSHSAFLRTFALQGLADLSAGEPALQRRAALALETALTDPSAAVRARARKLLAGLKRASR